MGIRRNFSRGGESRHFACPSQAADDTMQMDVHIMLYPFYTTKKILQVMETVPEMRFFGSSASFHAVYNNVIAVTAALLATDICVQQPYAENAYCHNLKWTFVTMLLRNKGQFYYYPLPSFATCFCSKGEDLVSCKLIAAWYQNSETDSCAVWMLYWYIKRSLQELSQLSCWHQVF